jgi:hypothetical protein
VLGALIITLNVQLVVMLFRVHMLRLALLGTTNTPIACSALLLFRANT